MLPSAYAQHHTSRTLRTWPIMLMSRAASSLAALDRTRLLNMVLLQRAAATAWPDAGDGLKGFDIAASFLLRPLSRECRSGQMTPKKAGLLSGRPCTCSPGACCPVRATITCGYSPECAADRGLGDGGHDRKGQDWRLSCRPRADRGPVPKAAAAASGERPAICRGQCGRYSTHRGGRGRRWLRPLCCHCGTG